MEGRVNRTIELLSQGQAVYYTGAHAGATLTHEQGVEDAATWADYINVGMEHGAFDLAGLEAYMRGLVEGGPTRSGHHTPTVMVEAPVEGASAEMVRYNAWQFRQILGRGVHGIMLCQVASAAAVAAFVESCRYPIHRMGVGELGEGTRGVGSEPVTTAIWGVDRDQYIAKADPWPLNPEGELLLGVKIESKAAIPHIEEILAVPGIGSAEMGPADMSLSLGYPWLPEPWPDPLLEIRDRVLSACRANGVAYLEGATPENVGWKIDEGVRVISGGRPETAEVGRAHSGRNMPV